MAKAPEDVELSEIPALETESPVDSSQEPDKSGVNAIDALEIDNRQFEKDKGDITKISLV